MPSYLIPIIITPTIISELEDDRKGAAIPLRIFLKLKKRKKATKNLRTPILKKLPSLFSSKFFHYRIHHLQFEKPLIHIENEIMTK